MGLGSARQPGVEYRLLEILAALWLEQIADRRQVEDIVADRDPRPAPPLGFRKNAERQVLDREVAALRARDPAGSRRVVSLVEGHGSFALGNQDQAWS